MGVGSSSWLPDSIEVCCVGAYFGQLREHPIFQHREKGGKAFLWKDIRTPPLMVPSSSHEVTTGLSPAPLTLLPCTVQGSSQPQLHHKSCWRWEGRTPPPSTLTEEPPKSSQRMTASRPSLEPKCRRLPPGSC